METVVLVRCIKRDERLVEAILSDAKKEYLALIKKEIEGIEMTLEISVDKQNYLKERKLIYEKGMSLNDYIEPDTSTINQNTEDITA